MKEVIVGLAIRRPRDGEPEVLLVEKAGVWITPGGKLEKGERPLDALFRECRQKLPKARIVTATRPWSRRFCGISPHRKHRIRITVYDIVVFGALNPAAEIQQACFVPLSTLAAYRISRETQRILDHWKKQLSRASE